MPLVISPPRTGENSSNRQVFLSSRHTDGPSRRFVIQVDDAESSEDEAAEETAQGAKGNATKKKADSSDSCNDPCSGVVSAFIRDIRRQTSQKKPASATTSVKPALPVLSSRAFITGAEFVTLRRKLAQEQSSLVREETALRQQQRALARLKFNQEQRIHKQEKLLRTFRRNQTIIVDMSRRIERFKSALAVYEQRVEKRRLGHMRNKNLLLRLQHLRAVGTSLSSSAPSAMKPQHSAPKHGEQFSAFDACSVCSFVDADAIVLTLANLLIDDAHIANP